MAMGAPPTLMVMGVIALCAVPMLLAQAVLPYEEEWRASPKDVSIDLLHMVSTGLTTEGWRSLTLGLMVGVAGWLSAQLGDTPWPSTWPVPVQVALALLIGDFGAYWVHRLCHRYDVLWRVHAMHHSSARLSMLSSGRNHPGNAILAYGSQLLPLTLLGAPVEVLALMSVFTGVHGMLQHANIDLRHGPLNHLFATAELHRWHHAANRADSDTNFGSNLILWDWVFGTRHLPADREIRVVGLPDLALPDNFLHHLVSPFVLDRYYVAATQAAEEVAGAEPTKSL
jgi:sterol desaturase/sphingolipid hydroxylase (fatty acid hydroxylase superfamily)